MAKRSAQQPPEPPVYLAMSRDAAATKISERTRAGEELKKRPITSLAEHSDVQKAYWTWSEYNEEMLRQMFTSSKIAEEYSSSIGFFGAGGPRRLDAEIHELHEDIDTKIRRLTSIRDRLELFQLAPGTQTSQPSVAARTAPPGGNDRVFVVHGHDEGAREAVARLLNSLGLTPIILHEQASEGRTIVEKLEHHGDVGYAVVLLTPDDVGGGDRDSLMPRARQNVVFELGYFMARLGRQRVCALHRSEVDLPSDYMGVVYIPLDSAAAWRFSLAKELRAAGFPVDMNKL